MTEKRHFPLGLGAAAGRRRSGLFRRTWRAAAWLAWTLISTFPTAQIVRAARHVGWLANQLKAGKRGDNKVRVRSDRTIDMPATATLLGMSPADLEQWFDRRRRQTAGVAYFSFGLGGLFFALWLWRVVTMPAEASYFLTAGEFVPCCLALFLVSLRSALQNYQLRSRRLVTFGEYLRVPNGLWPR